MKLQTGNDASSGNTRLDVAGDYHLVVAKATEPAKKNDGSIINGSLFGIHAVVFDGNPPGQEDKEIQLTFFGPSLRSSDGGKMSRKKVDRFLIATGLINPDQLGDEVEVDIEDCIGRQFCARLELSGDGDKKFLQLKFASVYHVDDPEAADIPKSKNALALIPAAQRKIGMQRLRGPSGAPTKEEIDSVPF